MRKLRYAAAREPRVQRSSGVHMAVFGKDEGLLRVGFYRLHQRPPRPVIGRRSAIFGRSPERSRGRPNDRSTFGSSPLPLSCAYCIIGYRRHSRLTRGVITQPSTCVPWKPKQSQQPATHVTSRSVGNVMELRLPFFHSHWKRGLVRLPASSSEHRSSCISWGPCSC